MAMAKLANRSVWGGGAMVETFASLETGTWTIVVTPPEGLSCLVSSGTDFEVVNEQREGGSPT